MEVYKQFMTLIDGDGEKYEVLCKSKTIITVLNKVGQTFNIPSVYLVDYNVWLKKNKKNLI